MVWNLIPRGCYWNVIDDQKVRNFCICVCVCVCECVLRTQNSVDWEDDVGLKGFGRRERINMMKYIEGNIQRADKIRKIRLFSWFRDIQQLEGWRRNISSHGKYKVSICLKTTKSDQLSTTNTTKHVE